MKLTIAICTVVERAELFRGLLTTLGVQLLKHDPAVTMEEGRAYNAEVEILWERDNKEISVGAKRQKLLERAQGDYICYVDDDDTVMSDYLSSIMEAIAQGPDCIGFMIDCDMEGTKKRAVASNRYQQWETGAYGFHYVRTIYHKTPVRRDIALQVGFKDMRFGEDADYSQRLKDSGLLKQEVFIPRELYIYRYRKEDQHTKYGFDRDKQADA